MAIKGKAGSKPAFMAHRVTASLLHVTVALALLGGCNQSGPSLDQTASAVKKTSTNARAPAQFAKGMAYADLRRLTIDAGWLPVIDPQCKANVVGSDYEATCSANTSLESCLICSHLPEVSGCSGDGYCGMYFKKDADRLHVVSYGMIEDWDVSGPKSRLTVDGWDISRD